MLSMGLDEDAPNALRKSATLSALDSVKPDVVFVPGWSLIEARSAIYWCSRNGVPIVLMSDTTKGDRERCFFKEYIKKYILGLASSCFVAGTRHAKYIEELSGRNTGIFLGYDVVDNLAFSSRAGAVRGSDGFYRKLHNLPSKYLLCCSRLIAEKNIHRLIKAYNYYRSMVKGTELIPLVIVGSGPLRSELESLIKELDLSKLVILVERASYEEMPVYYALARALILPSVSESWGLVVNEAMACSLPVAVSQNCGCSEDLIEEGRNGYVFDPHNVEMIAETLHSILDPSLDSDHMGRRSLEIVANWDLDRFVDGYVRSLYFAIDSPREARSLFDRLLSGFLMRV